MSAFIPWLILLTLFLLCLIVPAALLERWCRSDYRRYVRHRRALEKQREEYVPPLRPQPEHKRVAIRQGQVN